MVKRTPYKRLSVGSNPPPTTILMAALSTLPYPSLLGIFHNKDAGYLEVSRVTRRNLEYVGEFIIGFVGRSHWVDDARSTQVGPEDA